MREVQEAEAEERAGHARHKKKQTRTLKSRVKTADPAGVPADWQPGGGGGGKKLQVRRPGVPSQSSR